MNILSALIKISIYSAVILLAILLFKKILRKKLSAGIQFALWSLFILRLLLPFSIDSGLHLVTYTEPIQPVTQVEDAAPITNQEHSGIPITFSDEPQTLPAHTETTKQQDIIEVGQDNETPQPAVSAPPTSLSSTDIVTIVWLTGILVFLIFMGVSYVKLRKRIMTRSTALIPSKAATLIRQCEQRMGIKRPCEVRISNDFDSTVLLAALRPKLIIPTHMLDNPVVLEHCLLHEFAHYRRRDYLTYLLTNLLCAVYWFNPCVWIGTRLIKQDMESACDALVIKTMNDDERNKYARTLLSMFSNQPKRFQIAMGMGIATKKEAEKRLRGVYMKRKTSIGTKLTVALLALVMLTTCFTTACQPQLQEGKLTEVASLAGKITETSQETVQKTQKPMVTQDTNTQLPIEKKEVWEDTFLTKDGTTNVIANAEITVPHTQIYPVLDVEPLGFISTQIETVAKALFDGTQIYSGKDLLNKALIEEKIAELEKLLCKYQNNNENGQFDYVIGEVEDGIKRFKKMYETATDELPKNPPIYEFENGVVELSDVNGQEQRDLFVLDLGRNSQLRFETQKRYVITKEKIEVGTTISQDIDYEEAKEIADKYLSEMGIDYMDVSHVTVARVYIDNFDTTDVISICSKNGRTYAIKSDGTEVEVPPREYDPNIEPCYVFYYTREIDGILSTYFQDHNGTSAYSVDGDHSYKEPWEPECIKVFVDKDGIAELKWQSPSKAIADSKNVQIISFNEATTIAKENLHINSLSPEMRANMYITDVVLGMTRIQAINGYQYIPTWDFFGYYEIINENGENYTSSKNAFTLITISAIDGSIIDRGKEY